MRAVDWTSAVEIEPKASNSHIPCAKQVLLDLAGC
jgi:hypothetical protein